MIDLNDNAFLDPTRKESYPTNRLSNYSLITDFSSFDRLSFWNKIDFIHHVLDPKLLTDIYQNIPSKQLKALALYKINQLDKR